MKSMLHQFRDFAASKPGDEEYAGHSTQNCALAQFVKASFVYDSIWSYGWMLDGRTTRYSEDIETKALVAPWTFGALTDRLNKALAS